MQAVDQATTSRALRDLHTEWRSALAAFGEALMRADVADASADHPDAQAARRLGCGVKALEHRMAREPAHTLADLRLKGEVMAELLNDGEDALEAMVRSVIDDLARAA